MSCCTVIPPVHPNPYLDEKIVKDLQTVMATLDFMDEVYPLANVMEVDVNGRKGIVPVIFGQYSDKKNDYIQMFANDRKRGICFFEIQQGNYPISRGTEDGDLIRLPIRAVFTANLDKICEFADLTRTYDFTDELVAKAYNALNDSDLSINITSDIQIIRDKNLIFSKYTYLFNELDSLAFPDTGFALDFTIEVEPNFDCVGLTDLTDKRILDEDGCPILDEDGNYIYEE